uniref:Uncharacterized protein n=1 Tax=Candidatus Kentrum sp. SD TaxID=2126332 RepID=A0A450Z5C0_9GAMM|nr:MAG: hypothetical protein BECKSD772F_GA0070984_11466 [Candidatus Kentron sp. SD]VFK48868.1 MAG: hypothetical protein BECKSD772E_GA0070983_11466 [Candidatus Kentron sp. SD]
MITEAIILGAIEAAIYREDDRWRAIRLAPAGKETIDCTRSLALLMESHAERHALAEPLQDIHELEAHLRNWSRRYRALNLLIAGMDGQLTDGTRRTCIRAAEELLWDEDTSHFVRARLLGCPLPEEADIGGGLCLGSGMGDDSNCLFWSSPVLDSDIHARMMGEGLSGAGDRISAGFYRELLEIQTKIPMVRRILDEVLFFDPGIETNPEAARRAFIDAGVVADAALAFAAKSESALKQLVVDYSENPSLVAELGKPRPVLKRFGSHIHELIKKKSEKFLVEEKFSRVRGPLTKFSDQEAVRFAIPRSHSTPFEIKPLEAPVEISELAYRYVTGGANPSQFPRALDFPLLAA